MKHTPETKLWIADTRQSTYIDGLRAALKDRKVSQAAFARACGCSPSAISFLFTGYHSGAVAKYVWRTARERLSYPAPLPSADVDTDDPFWHLR